MQYEERWEKLKEIGSGGQGSVSLVRNKTKFATSLMKFQQSMELMSRHHSDEHKQKGYQDFLNLIYEFKNEEQGYLGALKVLHTPNESRNYDSAEKRIKDEIQAMKDVTHPNLIDVVDADTNEKWFVSRYYSNGTLTDKSHLYTGNLKKALLAIRPLVEGVASLHNNGILHRDIKPDNIFLSDNNELILGDFGLVFFNDVEHTRISDTFENVGSTDWMPAWASRIRIEDINPSFDVYSLGKTLWSMVSDSPVLRLWYFNEDEFNLENKFPNTKYMQLVNELLSKCVVEKEEACELQNADQLLEAIDEILDIIDIKADVINISERKCNQCGRGKYVCLNSYDNYNFGFTRIGDRRFNIYVCNNCGHVQLFTGSGSVPDPWYQGLVSI
ncbi:MAG: protein kinase family protein [Candidatus Dadabacteria bacterium]|nr:protein kinase family protein [Candidatus Dadabacteria bacterium]